MSNNKSQLDVHSQGNNGISLADWLQIVNLCVLIAGGILGYVLVDRVKAEVEATRFQLDQTKLSIDISKFMNDIRPTLNFNCTAWAMSPHKVQVSCSVKNIGAHRALITRPLVKLRVKGQEELIHSKYFDLKMLGENSLLPGTEGTTSYVIEVTPPADWSRVEVITVINASTDGVIIQVAKAALVGKMEATSVDALSRHDYSFTNFIDISTLAKIPQ